MQRQTPYANVRGYDNVRGYSNVREYAKIRGYSNVRGYATVRDMLYATVSTEGVSGVTVCNTEIGCMLSGPASAPRGSCPVTMSCVTAPICKLGEIIGCVLSGPASAPR